MPYDLSAVERGYGECSCDWEDDTIVLRYRADLTMRTMIALRRVAIGDLMADRKTRMPDVEAMVTELAQILLPSGPEVPEEERGWDLTDRGVPVPVTYDTICDLPPRLVTAMLGVISADIHDPNRRRPSSKRSSPAASSEGSPTSTVSSSTRNGQASLPGRSAASSTRATGRAGSTG